jgi:peptidoglycan hydrolase CwlO-like protein
MGRALSYEPTRRATKAAEGEVMRTTFATIVCALLMALPLCADSVPPELVLKDVLQLTDPQITTLQQLEQTRQQAVEPLAKQIAATQQALYAALEAPSADPAEVGKLVVTVDTLQRQIAQHQHDFGNGFLAMLTDAQRSQVQQIRGIEAALRAAEALHQLGL